MFRFLKKATPEEKFWNWFTLHSKRIFRFETDQDRVFDELSEQLDRLHTSLTFEFGPVERHRREFIISAEGDKEAFPVVQRLASAAPSLEEWIVIPFRPPKDLAHYSSVVIGDFQLSADDMWFTYEQEGPITHVDLYIRGWSEDRDEEFGLGAFLLLDSALGEFVVETRIGGVGRHALPADVTDLLPFREIVRVVALQIA
jgi:hypothetical protein